MVLKLLFSKLECKLKYVRKNLVIGSWVNLYPIVTFHFLSLMFKLDKSGDKIPSLPKTIRVLSDRFLVISETFKACS